MKRQSIRKTNRSQELAECLKPNPVYYPNPITFQKANQFNNGSRKRPLELLEDFISLDNDDDDDNQGSHGNGKESGTSTGCDSYVHWFRSDLRVNDNRGLAYAYRKARAEDRPIHGLYVINEHDWVAHMESGWKLTFIVEALKELGSSLSKYGMELHVRQFEPDTPLLSNSKAFSEWFVHTVEEITGTGNSTLVTANLQYEVDELYRDGRIARLGNTRNNFKLRLFHDQCIVRPGALTTGKGSQYTVFTPWYKKWVSYIEQDIDGTLKTPHGLNHPTDTKDFQQLPIDYHLPERFTSYIPEQHLHTPPATEAAALEAMKNFIEGRGTKYNENKDLLATDGTSLLSGYITIGIISTRTIVLSAYLANNRHIMNKNKDVKNNNSLETFIKEIAWRDFYKHVLCHWPFLSMDLPFKFETLNIKWQQDTTHFEQWCYGETGVPIVDAIMLQLLHTGYINNRARMITASFLAKNLLVDWRYGERWFRKHLIDYDVASNIGGWGFCSSTGVDCQPYFRVFNMTLQSQKFDPDGKFIRRWLHLPHTTDVHQPSNTAIVDLKESRERALEKYREVM